MRSAMQDGVSSLETVWAVLVNATSRSPIQLTRDI